MNIRKVVLGAVLAAIVAMVPAKASAATIQLGFILDSSGSIGSGNWNTIRTGLATAINTYIPVGGDDVYELTVISFSSNAVVVVSPTLVTDATVRANVATAVQNAAFLGSTTDYADAFAAMQTQLSGTIANAAFSYVNFATDGVPDSDAAGRAARNSLIGIGIDNLSIEGIGTGVDAAELQNFYCYPGPCDTTAPYNFPAQGFYIGVANAQGYADAIGNKIQVVTQNPVVPEPGTWTLMCLGLAGVVAARRRARRNQN